MHSRFSIDILSPSVKAQLCPANAPLHTSSLGLCRVTRPGRAACRNDFTHYLLVG